MNRFKIINYYFEENTQKMQQLDVIEITGAESSLIAQVSDFTEEKQSGPGIYERSLFEIVDTDITYDHEGGSQEEDILELVYSKKVQFKIEETILEEWNK